MNITKEDTLFSDANLVMQVLEALDDSSLATELDAFRTVIAFEFKMTEQQSKFLNFKTFAGVVGALIERASRAAPTQRLYRGRDLQEYEAELKQKTVRCLSLRPRHITIPEEKFSTTDIILHPDEHFQEDTGIYTKGMNVIRSLLEKSKVEGESKDESMVEIKDDGSEDELEEEPRPKTVTKEPTPMLSAPTKDRKRECKDRRERKSHSDNETPSSGTRKNKEPSARALRKLMRKVGVPRDGMTFDTDKYPKAVILHGDTKPYRNSLKSIGGKWNGRLKGWVFSRTKVIKAVDKDPPKEECFDDLEEAVQVEETD